MSSAAGRPLSLSRTFTGDVALKGERGRSFFDNLRPDGEAIRLQIATRFKTEGAEAFDLLQANGRDCAGAVQLLGMNKNRARFDASLARPCLTLRLRPC